MLEDAANNTALLTIHNGWARLAWSDGRCGIQRRASLWCEWRPESLACEQGRSQLSANVWTEDASKFFFKVCPFAGRWCWRWQVAAQCKAPAASAHFNCSYQRLVCILAHSSIEITKNYPFVVCRGAMKTDAELRVGLIFFCRFSSKSWTLHTENRGITLISTEMWMSIMRSEWPVGKFSSLEAMERLIMKPMPERRPSIVGFPDQKSVYPLTRNTHSHTRTHTHTHTHTYIYIYIYIYKFH